MNSMEPLTTDDVRRALDATGIPVEYVPSDEPTPTSELAAASIGCEVAQIAKSIAFLINGQPILVVMSGVNRTDDKKLAALLGVGRKKVKMAKREQCIEIFGYAPGGVPPVGHRTEGITIYLDRDLQQYERIYAAAGSTNLNFGMTPAQLAQMTNGQWIDVAKS